MKNGGKTSYEIRADLLRLSYDILAGKMEQENAVTGLSLAAPPSAEEIIVEATKLNRFVSDDHKNQS